MCLNYWQNYTIPIQVIIFMMHQEALFIIPALLMKIIILEKNGQNM